MRIFVFAAGIILCLVAQRSVLFPDVVGVKPDLLLIYTVFLAILKGPVSGLKTGFVIGLVEDIVEGAYFGINILAKMITGLIIGFLEPKIFKENYLVPALTVLMGTLVHELFFLFFGSIVGMDLSWSDGFWYQILPLTLANSLVAVVVYVPFYKIYTSKWLNKDR